MAGERGQPRRGQKRPPRLGEREEDAEAKPLKEARADAEQRFRRIIERRNALNDEARQARDARDAINAERRRVYDDVGGLMDQRLALQDQIKAHKAQRNEAQAKAKQLIAIKKEKRAGAAGGASGLVRDLEGQIRALEFKQQTTALGQKEELSVIEDIKKKTVELAEAKKLKAEQDAVFGEMKDLDEAINGWFGKADAAHAEVVRLSNEWQAITDRLEPQLKEMGHLKDEADKRHHEFLELRKRADEEHAKANELRGEVDQARNEVHKLYQERREIIREHRQSVKQALDDPDKIEESTDEAVRLLLQKGRISL